MTFKTQASDFKKNFQFPMQFNQIAYKHEKEKSILLPKLSSKKNLVASNKIPILHFTPQENDLLKTYPKKILKPKGIDKQDLAQVVHSLAQKEEVKIVYNDSEPLINHTSPQKEIAPSTVNHVMGLINQLEFLNTTEVHFSENEQQGSLIQYPIVWKKHNFNLPVCSFSFPTRKVLNTVSYNDAFDLQVSYTQENPQKYLFALTLIPKENQIRSHMKQNVLFLLDKSHSIGAKRFDLCRHAIGACLQQMQDTQNFNIIAFDNTCDFFSHGFSKKSTDNIKQAKKFLLEESPVSFLTTTDIFPVLKYIRSLKIGPQEQLTVILLTDGEFLNKRNNLLALELWTRTNKGSISFFVASLEKDKNIPLFDYLTQRNSGHVHVAHNDIQIKRSLCKLLRLTKMPIAKNIHFNFYSPQKHEVTFFPFQDKKNILFADQPYTIMGYTDSLEDFDLILQGKNGKEFFSFKKKVNFKTASVDESDLEKQASILKGYDYYEKFFTDKNPEHLKKAKSLLEPYKLEITFP